MSVMFCRAGVTVTQNVSPGATSWPGSPFISTMSNPNTTATVPESFNSANTSIGQTFTVTTTNYVLQTIDVYAGVGSGGTITLNLYDLGSQTAPNPSSYSGNVNLLGSGSGLSVSYVTQPYGVLEFDFTGSDQVILQAGHMYAFEVAGTQGTTPIYWMRAGSDTYSGGAAYRNEAWINGNSARDFALAVYGTVTSQSTQSGQCTVGWNDVHQKIDGFGGGVVFLDAGLDPVTDANMNTLFGTNNASQLGLSLLRVRIDPTTNWSNALSDAKKAVAWGASVMATPWTPPASMKSNGSTIGGSLLVAQYTNYAAYLNNFATYMAMNMSTNGVPLAALSIQNEPDITVTYESCSWTAVQLQAFFHTNAAAITNVPLMMPESYQFDPSMSDPTLNDTTAVTNVAIIGGHLYGTATTQEYTNAINKGKPTWMTEYLLNDQTWGTAIGTAQQIHSCLAVGNMSAYIWWKCLGDTNGLLNAAGTPQKRGYVMAQFSRFVHPGYYRIGVTNVAGSTLVSAYKNPGSGGFAVIAINNNLTTVTQTVNLANFNASSVIPWITSSNLSLSSQSAVTVANSSFSYPLPASSVVTFVGQAATATTTVGLTASSNPSTYGNAVTFTATVKTNGVAVGGINGETVTFYDGGTLLGTGTLNSSGQAAYTTSATQLSAATHSITAGYTGDTTYSGSTNSSALSQTINKATLTAGLTGTVSKTYDGTTTATLGAGNYTLSTVVSGDTVTLNNPTSGTYDTKNQGTAKTVSVTGLAISGASATNYTLANTSASAAVGTISAATLTYIANTTNMIYGSSVPGLSGSVSGFVGSDTLANATTGTLTFTTPATSSSSAGSYAINGSGLTANNGNYVFAQAAGNTTALSILPLVTPAFAGLGISVGSGGSQFSFSAQAGQNYKVLAADNLTLPVSQWTIVTNGTFGPTGVVTFTDGSATNLAQRFYQIVSP